MAWNQLLPNRRIRALPYSYQIFIQKQQSLTMTVRDKTSNNSNKRSKKVGEIPSALHQLQTLHHLLPHVYGSVPLVGSWDSSKAVILSLSSVPCV